MNAVVVDDDIKQDLRELLVLVVGHLDVGTVFELRQTVSVVGQIRVQVHQTLLELEHLAADLLRKIVYISLLSTRFITVTNSPVDLGKPELGDVVRVTD
jgi:hypothetical protein